jgi:hypothetical protein
LADARCIGHMLASSPLTRCTDFRLRINTHAYD